MKDIAYVQCDGQGAELGHSAGGKVSGSSRFENSRALTVLFARIF